MNYLEKKRFGCVAFYLVLVLFLTFTGCAPKTTQSPGVEIKDIEKTDTPMVSEDTEASVQQPEPQRLVDILIQEARKFSELNQNREALVVYNQALNQAMVTEIPTLITKIEQVLIKTEPNIIEELLENDQIVIPKPPLMYWLGVNYCVEKKYVKAQKILTQLCYEFPGHFYYEDALELLSLLQKETFKKDTIGCVLPLSGKYAFFGQNALEGIEFAVQEMSRKLNYPLKVIIKDNQSDELLAAVCVQELADLRVAGIVGPLLKALEAGKAAQKNHIPMIAMTQNNELSLEGDFLFTNSITPEMQARTLAAYSIFQLGLSRFAILYPDEPYGKKYMNLFWDALEEFNGSVHGVQAYKTDKTDFTEAIQKISGQYYPLSDALKDEFGLSVEDDLNYEEDLPTEILAESNVNQRKELKNTQEKIILDFDALFIPDSPQKLNLILPQLAFNDVTDIFLLGTNLWHSDQLLEGAKGYQRNAVITEGFFINSKNVQARQFTHDFKELYHKDPGYIQAISYDTASILFEAAMDPATESHDALKELLQGQKAFEGVTGRTIFDADGVVHKELFLITIKNDRFVEIIR